MSRRAARLRYAVLALAALLVLALTMSSRSLAEPVSYTTNASWALNIPYDSTSFGTEVGSFPVGTPGYVDGYKLEGRMLAATGRTLYLQTTFGDVQWVPVAILDPNDKSMDPCFVEVTPDGMTIALGTGFYQPVHVFPASLLSSVLPPTLSSDAAVKHYDLSYYDGAFRDSRYLFLNGGTDTGSAIFVIDTHVVGPDAISLVVANIPGASSGLAFDVGGDLVTGIGWDPDYTRTGELKIFDATELDAAIAHDDMITYDFSGHVIANNVLSAAALVFDDQGNLFVGGGDLFGTTGHYGYANVIDHSVVARTLAGGTPLDPDNASELTRIAPDPCMNDDATNVIYIAATKSVIVSANEATLPPECAMVDYSGGSTSGSTTVQLYVPPDAADQDGDGTPDQADSDYTPHQLVDRAEYLAFVAAFGATDQAASYNAAFDYDANGIIDWSDYATFQTRWGHEKP